MAFSDSKRSEPSVLPGPHERAPARSQWAAAEPGFEPGTRDPKSPVIPLHHSARTPRHDGTKIAPRTTDARSVEVPFVRISAECAEQTAALCATGEVGERARAPPCRWRRRVEVEQH